MKLKSKLTATIVSMCAAIAVMGVGVWASTSQSFRLTVQNDIDIKIDSVIADVWGEYAVYTEMMEEVTYNSTNLVTGNHENRTDKVPGLLRWRSAENGALDPDSGEPTNNAKKDETANNCYILYTQYGNGYNDGEDIVYNEDADWDNYEEEGSYENQGGVMGQDPSNGGVNNSGNHNGGTHAGGGTVNDPNATQPGNWKDVFVPGHDYDATNNPLPYSGMNNSGLKNYLNFANYQYLDSGDTGSLTTDPHPNIPYPDTYYNIDYTTSYAQIVFMYTIRQYYVPGAENTIYLTVQDEVTDAFAKEITDTAGNSRVQRNYYLNYNGTDATAGYGKTIAGTADQEHSVSNNFFDAYNASGAGTSGDGVDLATNWTALNAGVTALAGDPDDTAHPATADTIRGEAAHYKLPSPGNNGYWREDKDHVWHLMCVYTFERTSTNVDLSGLADGVGHSLSLLTQEQLEQYYDIEPDELDGATIEVGKVTPAADADSPALLKVDEGEVKFDVAMKNNTNFAFASRTDSADKTVKDDARRDKVARTPVTIDNYDGCLTDYADSDPLKNMKLDIEELAMGFQSVFGLVTNPNARYAFRFSNMVREYGTGDSDWYDLYEPNRQLVGEFTDYQGSSTDANPIFNINGVTENGKQVPVTNDRLGGYTPLAGA